MIKRTTIVLKSDDIFQALKEYIVNHVNGVTAQEVCNYRVHGDPDKHSITVELQEKEIP